jgi:O-antigen ligase
MVAVVAFVYLQRRDLKETEASLMFMLAILLWPLWILFMIVEWFFFREDFED